MKVLVKTIAGSHLFGTNTPESDKDYKGVYLPSDKEILLNTYKDTIRTSTGNDLDRNTKDDVDVELYSLSKFIKMLRNGDTSAYELLFTPENMILEKHPLWDLIVKHRNKFLSSKISSMVGYARQQANKYGIKGSRMGELNKVIEILKQAEKQLDFKNAKLKHNWEYIQENLKDFDHVHFIELNISTNKKENIVPALDILSKKFDHHCTFEHVLQILKKIYKNYGSRAREAKKNNGIDWKALSHAYRVSCQGIELLSTGHITLPLQGDTAKIAKDIKTGKMNYKDVSKLLENKLDEIEKVKETSKLRKELDLDYCNEVLYTIHKQIILGGL